MEILWLARTTDDVPAGHEWLSAAEQVALNRLRFPKRRAEWRLGRWSAKCAVGAWLRMSGDVAEPAEIEVWPTPSGAPRIWVRGRPGGAAVSLSHSHDAAFCALGETNGSLGCDVEKVEARSAAFVSDYFTEAEQEMVASFPAVRRDELVTLLWSGKESALKAVGEGLRGDPRSVEISSGQRLTGDWEALRAMDGEGRKFEGWWRSEGGFVWTLLAAPSPVALHRVDGGLECEDRRCSEGSAGARFESAYRGAPEVD